MNLNQIILLTVTIFTMIVVYCWAVTFAPSNFHHTAMTITRMKTITSGEV